MDLNNKILNNGIKILIIPWLTMDLLWIIVINMFTVNSLMVLVLLYVYMLIFDTILDVISTNKFISSKFDMKNLGEVDIILRIKITRTNDGIWLSQLHYIEKMLNKFGQTNCKPVSTPYDLCKHL